MSEIDKVLSDIRPKLRHVSPMTFWFSTGFAIFNILIGVGLLKANILITLKVAGILSLKVWGLIFLILGILMVYSLAINSWSMIKSLNSLGIGLKLAWWIELLSQLISGTSKTPFLLIIWSLLLFFQLVVFIYFTPEKENNE